MTEHKQGTLLRVRDKLSNISSLTQTEDLLWWQEEAREALAELDELIASVPDRVKQSVEFSEAHIESGIPIGDGMGKINLVCAKLLSEAVREE